MRLTYLSVAVFFGSLALAGCAARRSMDVVAYVDPERAYAVATFDVMPIRQCGDGNALIEQRMLGALAESLEGQGLRRESVSPDAIGIVTCTVRADENRTATTTTLVPLVNVLTGETLGAQARTVPGRAVTRETRTLSVELYSASELQEWISRNTGRPANEIEWPPVPLWTGSASMVGDAHVPTMIEAMLAAEPLGTREPGPAR